MTTEILLVLAVLLAAVVLFVFEWLCLDLIAIALMVILPWLGLVTPAQAFSGFASNTVLSVIAIMILGHGLDHSGVMTRFSALILRLAGDSERRLTSVVCAAVGLLSGCMKRHICRGE